MSAHLIVSAINTQPEDSTSIVPYGFGNYDSHRAFALRAVANQLSPGSCLGRFIDHPKPR